MSALGQKQTCATHKLMSALPPKADMCSALAHVCFGPKADMCNANRHVRFTPNSDIKCDVWDVRFGPIADTAGGERRLALLLGARADALPLSKTDRLNCEHNLASRSRLNELFMCARGLGEWQYLANNGPQSAVHKACKESGVDVCLFGRCDGPKPTY